MEQATHRLVRRRSPRLLVAVAVLIAWAISAAPPPAGAESSGANPGTVRGGLAAIAVGDEHSCAVLENGDVKCWGSGGNGRLGQDDTDDIGTGGGQMGANLPPINLGADAVAVTAGSAHTCAILEGGDVKCWGNNGSGRLGIGSGTSNVGNSPGDMASLPTVDLGTNVRATAIVAGSRHTCVIVEGGATDADDSNVKCWGNNTNGGLGYGDTANRGSSDSQMGDDLPLVELGTGRSATAIAAGFDHTCALLDDGSVKCWGLGNRGQLGNDSIGRLGDSAGEMGDALAPIDLGPGRYATAISAGGRVSCALLDDATAKCWGDGSFGKLGTDATGNQGNSASNTMANLGPITLPGTPVSISSGTDHTCALLDDGRTACWGRGADGRLGTGSTSNVGASEGSMAGLGPISLGRDALAIAAGGEHTCAVLDNFRVKCFGNNDDGQLGYEDTQSRGGSPGQMGNNLPQVDLNGHVVPIASVPAPPTGVSWEASGNSAAVSWTAPVSDGGSAITGTGCSAPRTTV